MTRTSTAEKLGAYIAAEQFALLPRPVVKKAMDCARDAIGCALGAQATAFAGMLNQFARARGGKPEAHVLGSGIPGACTTVAFVNALLINALDYDDIHQGHIGATVVAAALAAAEQNDVRGRDLITAIVVGYEVGIRLSEAMAHSAPRRLIHGFGTWEAIAAAAAAAKALKLGSPACAHALAIAGANAPVASVMKTVYGDRGPDMVKNNFGTAAEVGVSAALLAQSGMEGALDMFDGDTGFWRMYGTDSCDFKKFTLGLGKRYLISKVGFKPFSACRILQSTLEAAARIRQRLKDANSIDEIVLRAPRRACVWPFNNRRPRHMWAAQFSSPHAIAAVMTSLPPGPAWFTETALRDKALHKLADAVKLIPNNDQAAGKKHKPGAVPIQLSVRESGRWLKASVVVARGEGVRPVTSEVLREKFLRLSASTVSPARAMRLWNELGRLPTHTSVRALVGRGLASAGRGK